MAGQIEYFHMKFAWFRWVCLFVFQLSCSALLIRQLCCFHVPLSHIHTLAPHLLCRATAPFEMCVPQIHGARHAHGAHTHSSEHVGHCVAGDVNDRCQLNNQFRKDLHLYGQSVSWSALLRALLPRPIKMIHCYNQSIDCRVTHSGADSIVFVLIVYNVSHS